jgi:nitrogen fixation protein NifU and related proteins
MKLDDIRSLYEDMILDHNRNPRNFLKTPAASTHHAHGFNPVCNDEFQVHLRVKDGVIEDVGFDGAGCAISTASASMMTDAVKGKTVEQAKQLFHSVHQMLTHDDMAPPAPAVGKLGILAGVREYPMRVKCATLGWHVFNAALENRGDIVTTEEDEPAPYCPVPGTSGGKA